MTFRRLFASLLLALLVCPSVLAKAPAPYRNKQHGFTMTPAAGWQVANNPGQGLVVAFFAETVGDFRDNIGVMVQQVGKMSLDEYEKLSLAQLPSMKGKLIDKKRLTLGAVPAGRLEWSGSVGGRELVFISTYVIRNNKAYLLTATAPTKTYPERRSAFLQMADSFRLL